MAQDSKLSEAFKSRAALGGGVAASLVLGVILLHTEFIHEDILNDHPVIAGLRVGFRAAVTFAPLTAGLLYLRRDDNEFESIVKQAGIMVAALGTFAGLTQGLGVANLQEYHRGVKALPEAAYETPVHTTLGALNCNGDSKGFIKVTDPKDGRLKKLNCDVVPK